MSIASRRDKLIEIVMSFPEATSDDPGEGIKHIGFSVRKKRFAWYLEDHHGDGVIAVTCKAAAGLNTELPTAHPDRFFKPSYTGSRGWIGIRLDRENVDWNEVGRLLEDAYRMTAPKRLTAHLDIPQRKEKPGPDRNRAGPAIPSENTPGPRPQPPVPERHSDRC